MSSEPVLDLVVGFALSFVFLALIVMVIGATLRGRSANASMVAAAAEKHGLRLRGNGAEGLVDGFEVRISALSTTVRGPWTGVQLMRRGSSPREEGVVSTGDDDFDRRIVAIGDELAVFALLDDATRGLASRLIARGGRSVIGGVIADDPSLLDDMLALARALARPITFELVRRRFETAPASSRVIELALARLPGERGEILRYALADSNGKVRRIAAESVLKDGPAELHFLAERAMAATEGGGLSVAESSSSGSVSIANDAGTVSIVKKP